MNKIISKGVYLSMFFVFALIGCKKYDHYLPPPDSPTKVNLLQFIVQDFPEHSGNPNELYAVISVSDSSNEELVSNKKLSFTFNGKYVSENMQLPDGTYKVTKFLIVNAAGQVKYAAPKSQSAKAPQVRKPLDIDFALPNSSLLNLPMDILKVGFNDQPESFGYPAGTFGQQQTPRIETLVVKLRAVVTIGNINYDSIPASFKIVTWDANGVMHQKDTVLAAGVNQVKVPKSHVKYQFKMNKWGISDEITLDRQQVSEHETYILGGSRAAKKLRLEETFIFAGESYQPSAKTIYSYHSNGSLKQVEFYQKVPQHSTLQYTHKNVYVYAGSNVSRINTVEANGNISGFTAFAYNPQGTKVVNMHRKSYDQETFAAVTYSYPPGHALITIDYLYSNGKSMEYKMKFIGGNKVEDGAVSSNGSEGGTYRYDFNINPYAHLNVPDIYLSTLSKNNLIAQQKGYSGGFPSGDLYKLEYTYDADGYPKEVIKYYRSYLTGADLYKTKTIFTY